MPYADNLYSADDSDVESFSNELSPTDGYFSNRDHPQYVMVPDPSLETGTNIADSKAREAGEEAAASAEYHTTSRSAPSELPSSSPLRVSASVSSHYSPSSPTAYSPRSPTSLHRHQDNLYSESSPLLHSAAPPPAYSAATSQPAVQHFSGNYSTISARQLESGIREPESMGGPHDFNERSPLWLNQVKKLPRWRLCRNVLLVVLVLGLAVGFIVAAAKSGESNKKNKGDSSPEKSPPTKPEGGHGSYCLSGSINSPNTMPTYEFKSGRELVILQVTGGDPFSGGAAKVHTAGEIILRRQAKGEMDADTGYITFDVWISDPGIIYRVEMDTEVQALKVVTPEFADLSTGGDHCLSVEITVWIPPNASFETILVAATSLSVRFMDDVDFHVSQQSQIETSSGNIHLPSTYLPSIESSNSSRMPPGFSSQAISVGSSSGDITGAVLLYDLIDVETDSGKIDITVVPQPAPRDGSSNIAQLILGTASGDIRCRFPVWNPAEIPDRDYHTSVRTHSGAISGDYVIGKEATFKAISGNLEITALPTTFESSNFNTETTSGSTRVFVLETLSRHETPSALPVDNIDIGDDDPYLVHSPQVLPVAPVDSDEREIHPTTYQRHLRRLTSYHDCNSGSTDVHYPAEWEGEIRAVSISGNIAVGGDGVRTIKDSRKDWAYHEVVARKGPGAETASLLNVHGISGSLRVWVGDDCDGSDWCKAGAT